MKTWNQFTHFAALDWAKDHHDVIVVDRRGTVVADFRFEHSCGGWKLFNAVPAEKPQQSPFFVQALIEQVPQ